MPHQLKKLNNFSFVEDEIPLYQQVLIKLIELSTGKRKVAKIFQNIISQEATCSSFWDRAVSQLDLKIKINGNPLQNIPKKGSLLVVANHPFGQIDGLVLGYILEKIRPDFKIVAWDIMNEIDELKGSILPISFKNEYSSKKANLKTLQETIKTLKEGRAVAIFPSGEAAISDNYLGKAKEGKWQKFVSKLVLSTDTPVLPIYFHGQNSRMFQVIGNIGYYFKLSMFFNEINMMIGKDIYLTIGNTLSHSDYSAQKSNDDLIDFLYRETEKLSSHSSY